jgi:Catalytic LigB subunit of aromatic ring-opening dioxygenase
MAEIVLGLGTSHGSQVSIGPEWWGKHGELDRKRTPYDELVRSAPATLADELTPEVWQRKYERVQQAVAELGRTLQRADVNALVVIGDDQSEIYRARNMPAISVFWGDEVLDIPRDPTNVPPSRAASLWAKHAPQQTAYPVPAKLGLHVIEHFVDAGFDVAQIADQPEGRSIGHAFTFVRLRLMGEKLIPMLPIMLNTYFPPNQPPARRCYALGEALREALLAWPEDIRVGVVASGGLSHFVVDEELDRGFLNAIATHDAGHIKGIPEDKLQSGSSEMKNWIVAAGALTDLRLEVIDYVPGYRSPGGTGCGMAFARWS